MAAGSPAPIAQEPGSLLPHLRRDWAHPCHICAWTGLTSATSAPGLGSLRCLLSHKRAWADLTHKRAWADLTHKRAWADFSHKRAWADFSHKRAWAGLSHKRAWADLSHKRAWAASPTASPGG
jgi:hypothetical protein